MLVLVGARVWQGCTGVLTQVLKEHGAQAAAASVWS